MPPLHRLAACSGCGRQFDVSESPELADVEPGDAFDCSCGARVTVPTGRPTDAAVVSCAACGAPREGRREACTYCTSTFTLRELDLDAICPRCMARVSRRGKFCHHCSLPLTAPREPGTPTRHDCPACAAPATARAGGADGGTTTRALTSRRIGGDAGEETGLHVFECPRCAGLWLDREIFAVLLERAKGGRHLSVPEARVARPGGNGEAGGAGGGGAEGAIRPVAYRPCAVCSKLMNRKNYGRRSGVIIDLCKEHGAWFDHDELRQVIEWVRRGGFTDGEATRAILAEEAAADAARLRAATAPPDLMTSYGSSADAKGRGWILGETVYHALATLVAVTFDKLSERWR